MFGIIIGVFAGVLGGAIAFGLWSALPERLRPGRIPVALLAAIGIGVLTSRVEPPRPSTTAPVVERLIMSSELSAAASALRRNDPVAFRRAMATGSLFAERGEDEAAVARVRVALFAEARLKRREMSSRFHSDRLNLVHDELLELAETSPGLCWAIVRGRAEDVLTFPIGDELRRRELELLRRAFETGGAPAQALDHDTFQQVLDQVFSELQTKFGDDAFLVQGAPTAAQERRYCEVAAEYTRLLSLTPEPGRLFATAEDMLSGAERNGDPI